jgi:hypothetical protein
MAEIYGLYSGRDGKVRYVGSTVQATIGLSNTGANAAPFTTGYARNGELLIQLNMLFLTDAAMKGALVARGCGSTDFQSY